MRSSQKTVQVIFYLMFPICIVTITAWAASPLIAEGDPYLPIPAWCVSSYANYKQIYNYSVTISGFHSTSTQSGDLWSPIFIKLLVYLHPQS